VNELIEKNVIILLMMRQNIIRRKDLFKFNIDIEFGKCSEQPGVWAVFKCRKQVKAMNDCLTK
jgi:hypothetical protein